MEINRFKSAIGSVILVLGVAAAIGSYILQTTLDDWKSLGNSNVLYFVGRDMWVLVPIIYILSLSFVLIGIYIMYGADVFVE